MMEMEIFNLTLSYVIISKSSNFFLQINFELIFAALYFYIYALKECVSDFKNLILYSRY